ncbi:MULTISPECIES: tRNA lysidine(34) synthetase TilS [unclassified Rathayibacter]|uniref:tRNA lysidine(34) synthetase TilS n=1 Tax=unclassified Rathayibacter TaxID=2609250 RepID=UPI0006F61552|nr:MULTISPECIES: tRNA lysidine(34) synthetase TilS [unclassified Rathayibacter]KQQ03520.1 tRNA(Ile)-lysidine synthetase [Rathayibacter sp. Leaf294]KQS11976.1 tRNA(Ile)-lysidine synthetase [Rathayibacter sp. Leaf185]
MPDRPRLTPAVADIRRAVRASLDELDPGVLVLVALSGGADSLALASAVAFEAPRGGRRAGAVIVDHGLQEASAAIAGRAAEQAHSLGLSPVLREVVSVAAASGEGGPEAAARTARYRAFDDALVATGAAAILLGHTLDDQAETVLLGLARGAGAASLHGMAVVSGPLRRPLLGLRREATRAACADAGLEFWDDPHNDDPRYSRVRVRRSVLPVLEDELGPGIAEALARTAEQLREDGDALDAMALDWALELVGQNDEGHVTVDARGLAADPPALRQRIIRLVVSNEFGVSLSRAQTLAVAALVTDWHGQKGVDLPGVLATRVGPSLVFAPAGPR